MRLRWRILLGAALVSAAWWGLSYSAAQRRGPETPHDRSQDRPQDRGTAA
ncbi:hypothetical protein CLV63_10441 [Murinocardiopsis flavida]|uniref:Uncharacterized protein n=1 Tax=Murinocardiopsis flavida TaxID=645275 RepID=A0A2P8DNM3_9ACTN|nr:hypothetical protein [Murinocardiopsis flavida]PSK98817.1 hypothetical protein CLV63_10441 [Murinocardiopsis flavida]